jgi:large subunit ribosomal protein L6
MSRIGRKPILIPDGVNVEINQEQRIIKVKWPKGELQWQWPEGVIVKKEDNVITVSIKDEDYKNLWWLSRTLINNMVEWVTKGFEKKLVVVGVWYSAKVQWNKLILNLWYSHPIEYDIPEWIQIKTEKDQKGNDVVVVSWIDKQLVWQVAAVIRSFKKPDPYKGKGVRYIDKVIKLKPWKQAKK